MRVSRRCIGLAEAAVVGVLTLSPTVAWASGAPGAGAGPSNVRVSPGQVHQGATLAVTASGCTGGGTVTSSVFPTVTLPRGATSTATARVDNTATPGRATLSVHCGGRTAHATFTVLAGTAAQGGLGGSYTPGTSEVAAGAALTGMAAAAGAVLLRRRSRGRI
ncbi:hypothetical protein QFZ82_001099 [Streptomyces sp. V4I23]|uniref:hypothetical protein n=1 Tax=Streptomyces sp. V4I23 TaxID=3042282 RepID=UPI002784D709|nr:hypothetical protein [Streptomyces sp. V4I23]MDQ1006614.1 hypothetical protein [Streptomyces sp. V4I23]